MRNGINTLVVHGNAVILGELHSGQQAPRLLQQLMLTIKFGVRNEAGEATIL